MCNTLAQVHLIIVCVCVSVSFYLMSFILLFGSSVAFFSASSLAMFCLACVHSAFVLAWWIGNCAKCVVKQDNLCAINGDLTLFANCWMLLFSIYFSMLFACFASIYIFLRIKMKSTRISCLNFSIEYV